MPRRKTSLRKSVRRLKKRGGGKSRPMSRRLTKRRVRSRKGGIIEEAKPKFQKGHTILWDNCVYDIQDIYKEQSQQYYSLIDKKDSANVTSLVREVDCGDETTKAAYEIAYEIPDRQLGTLVSATDFMNAASFNTMHDYDINDMCAVMHSDGKWKYGRIQEYHPSTGEELPTVEIVVNNHHNVKYEESCEPKTGFLNKKNVLKLGTR